MEKSWAPILASIIAVFSVEVLRPLTALLLLMGLDIVAGVLLAIEQRRLSSDIMWVGLIRKAMILLLVAAAYIFDHHFAKGLGFQLSSALAIAFCLRELLSLVEKAAKAGVGVPKWFVDRLKVANKELNDNNGAEG